MKARGLGGSWRNGARRGVVVGSPELGRVGALVVSLSGWQVARGNPMSPVQALKYGRAARHSRLPHPACDGQLRGEGWARTTGGVLAGGACPGWPCVVLSRGGRLESRGGRREGAPRGVSASDSTIADAEDADPARKGEPQLCCWGCGGEPNAPQVQKQAVCCPQPCLVSWRGRGLAPSDGRRWPPGECCQREPPPPNIRKRLGLAHAPTGAGGAPFCHVLAVPILSYKSHLAAGQVGGRRGAHACPPLFLWLSALGWGGCEGGLLIFSWQGRPPQQADTNRCRPIKFHLTPARTRSQRGRLAREEGSLALGPS